MFRERKIRTIFVLHKLFEHPKGSGTSQQNSRDIPDSSLRNPRKTITSREGANFSATTPLRGRCPPHQVVSRPKTCIFVPFFCLCVGGLKSISENFLKHSHQALVWAAHCRLSSFLCFLSFLIARFVPLRAGFGDWSAGCPSVKNKPGFFKTTPLPEWHPPFSSFSSFGGSEKRSPCFQWVECKFVICAVFVKTAPFWQGTRTRFNKNTVCAAPSLFW